MSVVQRSLTLGNYAFTAVALIVALFALWMWAQAVIAWGPASFAEALTWTFVTLVAFVPVFVIEWVQNRGA